MSNTLYLLIGLGVLVVIGFMMKFFSPKNFKTFLHDGLSLDETKISLMKIAFTIFNGIAIWTVFTMGDIPDNVLYLILGLGSGIVGMNISNSTISRKKIYEEVFNKTSSWIDEDIDDIYENSEK
jgi:riboflavin transporter FmnP